MIISLGTLFGIVWVYQGTENIRWEGDLHVLLTPGTLFEMFVLSEESETNFLYGELSEIFCEKLVGTGSQTFIEKFFERTWDTFDTFWLTGLMYSIAIIACAISSGI